MRGWFVFYGVDVRGSIRFRWYANTEIMEIYEVVITVTVNIGAMVQAVKYAVKMY